MAANSSRSVCTDDLFVALLIFEGAEEQDIVGHYVTNWMSLALLG